MLEPPDPPAKTAPGKFELTIPRAAWVLSSMTICWAFCILLIFANIAAVCVWQAWLGQFTFTVPPSVALTEPLAPVPPAPLPATLPDCPLPAAAPLPGTPLPATLPVAPVPPMSPDVAIPLVEMFPLPAPEPGLAAPVVPGEPDIPDPEPTVGAGVLLAQPKKITIPAIPKGVACLGFFGFRP